MQFSLGPNTVMWKREWEWISTEESILVSQTWASIPCATIQPGDETNFLHIPHTALKEWQPCLGDRLSTGDANLEVKIFPWWRETWCSYRSRQFAPARSGRGYDDPARSNRVGNVHTLLCIGMGFTFLSLLHPHSWGPTSSSLDPCLPTAKQNE